MHLTRTFKKVFALAFVAGATAIIPSLTSTAKAQETVDVAVAPPPIPAYEQPEIPGDGYIWTPGYWAYGPGGYVWVQGAWVQPPYVNALWTPGWWGYGPRGYFWNAGYWGPEVGYYGGINYGFGYFGVGFYGGYWNGGHFWYNRAYGHYGPGFHGIFYNRTYNGFSGRPGGPGFNAHPPSQYAPHQAAFNHGSSINGTTFRNAGQVPNHGAQGFAGSHNEMSRGPQPANGFGQTHGYNPAPQSHTAPAPQYRNYGSPQTHNAPAAPGGGYGGYGGGHSSAPSGGGYSGGGHASAPSGGGGASHPTGGHR